MYLDKRVNSATVLTGLIGNPLGHTVSPQLHNSLFKRMGINGIYLPLQVEKDKLGDAVKGLSSLGFAGFNVTIPYKVAVLDYVDEASEAVKLLGTANTVKIKDGRLYAYNTDADGFADSFRMQAGTDFKSKDVCIIGAGGTTRAIAIKIAMEGARRISIINRTEIKAEELASYINEIIQNTDKKTDIAYGYSSCSEIAAERLKQCSVIVNTTSVGMYPNNDFSPLSDEFSFDKDQIVYDVIYKPGKTKLLKRAEDGGCRTINGAGMLFYQGVRAFEIFMDTKIPCEISENLSKAFFKFIGV